MTADDAYVTPTVTPSTHRVNILRQTILRVCDRELSKVKYATPSYATPSEDTPKGYGDTKAGVQHVQAHTFQQL